MVLPRGLPPLFETLLSVGRGNVDLDAQRRRAAQSRGRATKIRESPAGDFSFQNLINKFAPSRPAPKSTRGRGADPNVGLTKGIVGSDRQTNRQNLSRQVQAPSRQKMFGMQRQGLSGFQDAGKPGLLGNQFTQNRLSNFMAKRFPEQQLDFSQFEGDFTGISTEGLDFSVQGNAANARGMQGVMKHRSLAERASRETGVPTALILAVMGLESGGNPNAVSPAGATGLMQVMPNYWSATAQQVAGSSNLRDPWVNVRTGAEVLKQNKDRWGTWEKAAMAYLAGNPNSTAVDAHGTGVNTYRKIVADNLAWLQQQGIGQSSRQAFSGGNFTAAPSQALNRAINEAKQFAGQPYVWGGANPNTGFDCSGLMQWAYGKAGIRLPRTAGEQYDNTQRISAGEARPGDLVFFHSTYNNPYHHITHVGIYLGNGQMFHSGSGGVGVVSLNTDYWRGKLAGYGRVRG